MSVTIGAACVAISGVQPARAGAAVGRRRDVNAPQLHAGTPGVHITDSTSDGHPSPVYGDIDGDGHDEAALAVWSLVFTPRSDS